MVSGEQTERGTERDGADGYEQAHLKRGAAAEERAGEDVAPEIVGAEEMRGSQGPFLY